MTMGAHGRKIQAFHFVGETLRDGSPIPVTGKKLCFSGRPVLCTQGLHASRKPSQALNYATGSTLCLVELGGVIVQGEDKLAATERTILARIDAMPVLQYFARQQALSVLHLWKECPPDCVLDYLMTGDPDLQVEARLVAVAKAQSLWSRLRLAQSAQPAIQSPEECLTDSGARAAACAVESAACAAEAATYSAEAGACSALWSVAWSTESEAWSTETKAFSTASKLEKYSAAAWSEFDARIYAEFELNKR